MSQSMSGESRSLFATFERYITLKSSFIVLFLTVVQIAGIGQCGAAFRSPNMLFLGSRLRFFYLLRFSIRCDVARASILRSLRGPCYSDASSSTTSTYPYRPLTHGFRFCKSFVLNMVYKVVHKNVHLRSSSSLVRTV